MTLTKRIFQGTLNDRYGYPVKVVWYYDIGEKDSDNAPTVFQPGSGDGPFDDYHVAELACNLAYEKKREALNKSVYDELVIDGATADLIYHHVIEDASDNRAAAMVWKQIREKENTLDYAEGEKEYSIDEYEAAIVQMLKDFDFSD